MFLSTMSLTMAIGRNAMQYLMKVKLKALHFIAKSYLLDNNINPLCVPTKARMLGPYSTKGAYQLRCLMDRIEIQKPYFDEKTSLRHSQNTYWTKSTFYLTNSFIRCRDHNAITFSCLGEYKKK